ncbi:hypothetical protein C8A01DRAFT_36889 [Parachaetomium inaequale]|uniref:LicD/FKTN/FKRP nucleotidyltransferase domain-containing protein n=1 Tax=Parachaetomium inaequale TaxID=2588326 RepID=A0AAN6SR88_9PEZI|nr:hypothetical protein C8A01DRAFT_36889 [Parachaetomium inaequale]
MRPLAALFSNHKVLLLLTVLLVLSAILSTAAVARGGGQPFSFYVQQKQEQQQQQTPLSQQTPSPQENQGQKALSEGQRALIPEYKYFQEAGGTLELAHYDARFFTAPIPYTTHRTILTHLIRSYLTTFASLNLETWLAHGTLLGWYWNGRIMPWDFDVDAQVSGTTLAILAEQHNGSVHTYTAHTNPTTGQEENRTYLLDVNPFATRVGWGRGENFIDARWIDVETGMFVDITGLVERDPRGQPGVWSCKNYHGYRPEELFPLRETEFEGVPAMVPWEYEGVLVGEYGEKSLVVTEWEGHRWDPDSKEWVKMNETETEEVL